MVELGIHIARQVHSPTPVARTTLPVGQTLHVGEPDRLGPQKPPRPTGSSDPVQEGAGSNLGRQGQAPADVSLTAAQHRGVNGQTERLKSRCGCPVHQASDEVPVAPGVHLEPQTGSRSGYRRTLLDRPGTHGGQGERNPGSASRPDHSQLAGRIGDPGEPGGSQYQGEGQRPTQQGGGRIQGA